MADLLPSNRTVRAWVFAATALFIIGGPIYRQVLGGESVAFRDWVMFRGIGLGVLDLRFERFRDGAWEELDYVDPLRRKFGVKAHRSLRLVGEEGLMKAEQAMCELFPNESIRVFARKGTRFRGWVELRYLDLLDCDRIRGQ